MAVLNTLVQLIGICVSIYLAFAHSITQSIALLTVMGISHFALTTLSNNLMLIHERRLPKEKLEELRVRALFGAEAGYVPKAWGIISTTCGFVYFCIAVGAIWFFVSR